MLTGVRYVLLLLAIPAALGAYFLTGTVIAGLGLSGPIKELAVIFLPLLVAGLVSIPFIAPFVDYKAKQALANAPGAQARAAAEAKAKTTGAPKAGVTPTTNPTADTKPGAKGPKA